jgi:GNAT superfamily N-acetyltransferase
LTISRVLLDDERALAAVAEFRGAYDLAQFGGSVVQTAAQLRAEIADSEFKRQLFWAAWEGDRVVGEASVDLPLQENLDLVYAELQVAHDARGRGIGTRLLEEALLPAIRAEGRERVEAYGEFWLDEDVDDPAHPANRIMRRLGVERKNVAVCRTAPLPLDAALEAELQAEVDARSAGYSTLIWANRVPDEYLEQYGKLLTQLELDEPDEEVVGEIADYTPERIREAEARSTASGYFSIIAVSQAPDGSLAAHSEVEVRTEPGADLAFQRNTLVFEEHRGHRLGLALKLATHRAIAEQFPAVRRIATWNSHVNPWMIEVNERMGYRPRYREVIYQTA